MLSLIAREERVDTLQKGGSSGWGKQPSSISPKIGGDTQALILLDFAVFRAPVLDRIID
jgi:hypothetical protein